MLVARLPVGRLLALKLSLFLTGSPAPCATVRASRLLNPPVCLRFLLLGLPFWFVLISCILGNDDNLGHWSKSQRYH